MALEGYTIKPITNKIAMLFVVRLHYLHRKCPCSFAFSLLKPNNCVVGIICYGTPASAPLRKGICGIEHANNVIELTRLWIHDNVPRNAASYLIGNTLRLVDKEIIVSFADTSQGHIGYVYQATNWIYTGLSAKRTDWVVDGETKHGQTWADKYTAVEIREKFGDRFHLRTRPRKHRYVFFNAPKSHRKELLRQLRYPILPYPKA